MAVQIGRNDPCSCGSGKKHKRCCLEISPHNLEIVDFEWRKLRQLEGMVLDQHLSPYALKELPKGIIELALSDCLPEDLPDTLDKELLFQNFFIPWFLFNWIPFDDFRVKQFDSESTIAQNYVKKYENKLTSAEKRFIEVMSQSYYSFYHVLHVEFEKTLEIKDILLGTTHTLKERQGTHHLKRGDIIFSRILTLDQQSIFVGMAPFIIPPRYSSDILHFKKWLIEENETQELTPESLQESDLELVDYFFDLMKAAFDNPFPTLCNTDGDLLIFSKSHFELTLAPEEALERLMPVTLTRNLESFLKDANHYKSGKIKRLVIPWLKKGNKRNKEWDTTVMGHIILEKGKLILETNSEKRTQQGKKLLAKYLGEFISFQQTVMESPEQKIKSSKKLSTEVKENPLMAIPETQEQIKALAKAHWENWFDDPIPALDNKTPREAAKTVEGREQLEALLLLYERYDLEREENNLFKADIHYLKTKLALDK